MPDKAISAIIWTTPIWSRIYSTDSLFSKIITSLVRTIQEHNPFPALDIQIIERNDNETETWQFETTRIIKSSFMHSIENQ